MEAKPKKFPLFRQSKPSPGSSTGKDGKTSQGQRKAEAKLTPVLHTLDTALSVLVASLDGVPVPGLKGALGGLLAVIKGTELQQQNQEALETLEEHINKLINDIVTPLIGAGKNPIPKGLQTRITQLVTEISEINAEAGKRTGGKVVKKFFTGTNDARIISGLNKQLKDALDRFFVSGSISMELEFRTLKTASYNTLLDKLPRVQARFNSSSRATAAKCFQGTRVKLLQSIRTWITNKDPKQPRIFWLSGLAGTGKSTVAQTVAEYANERGLLGASFFFSRDETDRSNSALVFSTIAYQLAVFNDHFKALIADALEKDPDVGHANFQTQLQNLIIKPLRQLEDSFTVIVVMDALDECAQEKDMSDMLKLLATELRTLVFQLKFFVTSRPEQQIRTAFDAPVLSSISRPFILHDIETAIVRKDIEIFLRHRLAEVGMSMLRKSSWPSNEDLQKLVAKSAGLFIFASTAVRFIEDEIYDDPEGQLEILLHTAGDAAPSSPLGSLDDLYLQVLSKALPKTAPAIRKERFQTTVGAIVVLLDPLPLSAIEKLLSIDPGSARKALIRLVSLIAVPDDDENVARVLHPSFPDYLTNPDRCTDASYYIDRQKHHDRLATHCLELMMKSLKRDICGIKDPSKANAEVWNLDRRLQVVAPAELRYACIHWAAHISKSSPNDSAIIKLIKSFASKYFLFWLELLSLIGELEVAIPCIKLIQHYCRQFNELHSFFNDAERVVLKFYEPIAKSALHVYYSALPFVPKTTALYRFYSSHLKDSVTPVCGVNQYWDPLLRTMEGHEDQVRSVSFSPDGSRIVSASWDSTIRVWDSLTGALLTTLEGHERDAKSAMFSPNCDYIASSSEDETVRLWDVSTGTELVVFKEHTRDVTSVAFAPTTTHLASGSEDSTVRIWDWQERKLVATLEGHDHYVRSVSYSPDSSYIASGSEDGTVRIWDAVEHCLVATLSGHTGAVLGVTYFPNSERIASGGDETVRIWDSWNHSLITTLSGHSSYVTSVAVSPDENRLVSGSGDQTVRLWDLNTLQLVSTFHQHITTIWSVAFSPDGTRCVSGSADRTIRLWDTSTTTNKSSWTNRASYITSVAYSPVGTYIICGSENGTLQIWDASTLLSVTAIQAHQREITSLTFSPDGSLIAAASGDRTISLWDVSSHKRITSLVGHTRLVRSVAFSFDGTRIVSGSEDTTIRIWRSPTGELVKVIDPGHSSYVMSVGFSADDRFIVSGSEGAAVDIWHASTGEAAATLEGHLRDVMGVAFSPDGSTLVSASEDKTMRLWDAVTHECLQTFEGHSRDLRSVAFSKDSRYLVTGSEDMTARLWDVQTGQLIHTFEGHTGYVRSAAFSPDGKYIVSGSEDSTVRRWSTSEYDWVHLESHSSAVTCASFSEDDSQVVLGTKDGLVQVWSMCEGNLLSTLKGHTRYVTSVSFSQDQKHILSGSGDKTMRLWDASTFTLVRTFGEHEQVITAVAFSKDDQSAVSWEGQHSEVHWDIQTGRRLQTVPAKKQQILHRPSVHDAASQQWLTHTTGGSSRRIWLAADMRGVVWPSRTSRVLISSYQDKIIIIDFATMR